MPTKKQIMWDVAVIGGGPAGMIAAGRAAERGAKVVIIEKNDSLGKKLLITGGGRCNLTNAELDTRAFLSKFKKNDQFLFSAFSQFGVKETLDFFQKHGMTTKIEAEKRVFPESDRAESVLNVLVRYMKHGNVTILSNAPVTDFIMQDDTIQGVMIENGKEVRAREFILATGGKSHPETGSTGEGFQWLKKIGHTIIEPSAALVPIAIKDAWVKSLQGVSFRDAKITVFQNGVKSDSRKGKILFTHFGLSGPLVLNMSRDIGELLKYGAVMLSLDIFPTLDNGALDRKLQEIIANASNKKIKNILDTLVPAALVPVVIKLSGIRADITANSMTRDERLGVVKTLKDMPMQVSGLLGASKAIVTSGGVALTEVDFKTMRSRKIKNLFLIGDILNIDRPSGGYSLQLCWTTGYVAGENASV